MKIEEKIATINVPALKPIPTGYAYDVQEFWDIFIKPNLISQTVAKGWLDLLEKYVNDKDAVFAIRIYNDRPNKDNYLLRRGFLNHITGTNNFFVYDDNDLAVYISKMALDGYVPSYDDFKNAFVNRTIPIRFNASCKEERAKAAFKISGKAPKIGSAGYKVSHIINTGEGYNIDGQCLNIASICDKYFPRGDYSDWKMDPINNCYVRDINVSNPEAIKFLKAHFLRFACPLNYILTPKTGKNSCQKLGVYVYRNDVGESIELQQYAAQMFEKEYSKLYRRYISLLMLPAGFTYSNPSAGATVLDINFGLNVKSTKMPKSAKTSKAVKKTVPVATTSGSGVGQYALALFTELLENGKLTPAEIHNLSEKDYCSCNFKVSFPILVDVTKDDIPARRYYKKLVVGKYYITSQWYAKSRPYLEQYKKRNS